MKTKSEEYGHVGKTRSPIHFARRIKNLEDQIFHAKLRWEGFGCSTSLRKLEQARKVLSYFQRENLGAINGGSEK